jgi:superfamily II DNA or RNA helicase
MSYKLSKLDLTNADILKIKNDLYVEGVESEYGPRETLDCWGETKKSFYLPFYYSKKRWGVQVNDREYPRVDYKMTVGYKDQNQEECVKECIDILKKQKTVLLSLHTGGGKTVGGLMLAQKTKYKTAVLIHRAILAEQWAESIEKFTTATVQIVDTKTKIHPDADFYIFNIAYVPKFWNKLQQSWDRKKPSQPDYKTIGTLIVDEAHIACASEMAKALQYFEPKYAIALTATPKRRDGLDKMLDLYFGEKRVVRISETPFTVFRVSTGIKPVYGTNAFGKKKWGDVVQYLSVSEQRNKLIVKIVKSNGDKTIMIMCKLTKHCDELARLIREENIIVTVMKGTDKEYDKTAKVLISTFSKLGVGFDDSRLDMLILASSVKEVEQYAGRLRYSPGKDRVIYDLVDDDYSCQKHWIERKDWYESRNGTVKYIKSDIKTEKVKTKRFAPVKK